MTEEAAPIALESEDTTGGIGGDFGDFAVALVSDEDDAPVPPDFDDDSLWDDAARTDSRDDAASLASPSSVGASGGPGPVVEGFAEGLTARIKALLGVKNAEDAAAEREEKAKKAQKARREEKKKRREKEKKKRAAAVRFVVFLNRVRRVFGFPGASSGRPGHEREPRDRRPRVRLGRVRQRQFRVFARTEKRQGRPARVALAPSAGRSSPPPLFRDAFESAFDSALRLRTRVHGFHVSGQLRVYLFDVPGGANGRCASSWCSSPDARGCVLPKGAPRSRRRRPCATGRRADAGWALGTNAHVASTYLQLCAVRFLNRRGVRPGCGRACAAVAARAWQHTWFPGRQAWRAADAGLGVGKVAARRARALLTPRSRQAGAPRRTRVLRALEEHLETPAASRSASSTPRRTTAWTRGASRFSARAGASARGCWQTVRSRRWRAASRSGRSVFPAVHASLATLVPVAATTIARRARVSPQCFGPSTWSSRRRKARACAIRLRRVRRVRTSASPALRVQPTFGFVLLAENGNSRHKHSVGGEAREPAPVAQQPWFRPGAEWRGVAFVVLAAARVATQSLRDARF